MTGYDLCLTTSKIGIDNAVDIICRTAADLTK